MKKTLISIAFILLAAWNAYLTSELANVYTELKDVYAYLATEIKTRKQNESAIEKDLRLLRTDTDILLHGYKE